MQQLGYYRQPTLFQDHIVFVSDEDLWRVSKQGGEAMRLTNSLGQVSDPAFSPDGQWIAFTGREEGHAEVYRIPATGGSIERLTYITEGAVVLGWTPEGEILYKTSRSAPAQSLPHPWINHIYLLNPETKVARRLKCGPAEFVHFSGKANVIQRHGYGYVSWKRYRGGTKGEIWIDHKGQGDYEKLIDLPTNNLCPHWIEDRIYFLSDHEGMGNVYSCTPEGQDLKAETYQKEFYVRDLSAYEDTLITMAGGDIYVHELKTGESKKVEILFSSQRVHRQRKFANPQKYFRSYDLDAKGQRLGILTRGRPFTFANWEGAVTQHGHRDGVRYNHLIWLPDPKYVLITRNSEGEDIIELHGLDLDEPMKLLKFKDLGRISLIEAAPHGDWVAVTNHRCEILILNLKTQKQTLIGKSAHGLVYGISWSPDGRYLAYDTTLSTTLRAIQVYDTKTKRTYQVTKPILEDMRPCFDPEGKYLYFLSKRIYNPISDTMQFEYGFPKGMKPYLLTLQKDSLSPFEPRLQEEEKKSKEEKKAEKGQKPVEIDFEGIEDRIIEFPVPEGDYKAIFGIPGKALYLTDYLRGLLEEEDDESPFTLRAYDFESQKEEVFASCISSLALSGDKSQLAYASQKKLRVIKSSEKPVDNDCSYKKGGWVEWDRIRLSVDPTAEWKLMYEEAWRLQRDFYWTADMSKVDWDQVYQKYLPLIDRISTREELNDVISEMQGELGCSHAYVSGGDLSYPPYYPIGELGCDFEWDEKAKGYRIINLAKGDPWIPEATSPLIQSGIHLKEGDLVFSINGQPLDYKTTPAMLLVNQADNLVEIQAQVKGERKKKRFTLRTLHSQNGARYRDWVENNRTYIRNKTNGQVGYIHIPNMVGKGYAEFHRAFMAELDLPGLIVDVRYNRGGSVSPLLLEKLARRRLGYDETRWFGQIPYPANAPMGPMVGLTNEYAGSDGDMFSHAFKVMKLGPLIGKRSWGGVVGIWPRYSLIDGGETTQPEFSAWFPNVGWNIENYGVDPDIEVEIAPQDYERRSDPQLDRAIAEVEKVIKETNPDWKNSGGA